MTSDTTQSELATDATEPVSDSAGDSVPEDLERLRELIDPARVVLWDFDGPICRLFAGHSAEQVAIELVEWLERQGLHGLLTEAERVSPDPHVVLRAVDHRHPGSDLVAELEERLTQEELRAVPRAFPTPYVDILIQTWRAVGSRLAITTNNSARTVGTYLTERQLTGCFAPHLYGRTQALHQLKPDPHCLNRALGAMGAAPSAALMIGDSPADFLAARRAGVPFLGYARNDRKEKELRAVGAETIVNSFAPVLRVVRDRRPGTGQA
ncbi:HAD family hydrolase [Streptomyces geranii]|uniref:HAD family hydrolase n=1 Tax=Streptomyces geranii TaxID=2058923 RepID=UPI0038CD2EB9